MLKVLLYGLATFMETGIGVWIFSQTFSERRILEKKYYVLEWLLYSLIFFGIYNFSVSLYSMTSPRRKNAVLSEIRTACCILCVTMTIV